MVVESAAICAADRDEIDILPPSWLTPRRHDQPDKRKNDPLTNAPRESHQSRPASPSFPFKRLRVLGNRPFTQLVNANLTVPGVSAFCTRSPASRNVQPLP